MSGDADRDVRRRTVLSATAGLVGLAGCSGGDDDSGTISGEDPTDTATATEDGESTATATGTNASTETTSRGSSVGSMCRITDKTIDEFSVVGCQSEVQGQDFVVRLEVRNDGSRVTDLTDYGLTVRAYESTEASYSNQFNTGLALSYPGGSEVGPDEATRIVVRLGFTESANPENVELYTVSVRCLGGNGVYCQ